MVLNYTLNHSFNKVLEANLRRADWEMTNSFTCIDDFKQLDADRIRFYRRVGNGDNTTDRTPTFNWEEVTYNRKTKEIEQTTLVGNPNKTSSMIDRMTFKGDGDKVHIKNQWYDTQGNNIAKIELFKNDIFNLKKTLQFVEWAKEEKH